MQETPSCILSAHYYKEAHVKFRPDWLKIFREKAKKEK